MKDKSKWKQIKPSLIGHDFILENYRGGKLSFLYVAPPSANAERQFLSVRTIADASQPDNFVNLRRHHSQFDTVYFGTFQDYHLEGKGEATLRRFHRWPGGARSDEPSQVRSSWAFKSVSSAARRRVLSIGFTSTNKRLCVPFFLGPNIATPADGEEGGDQFIVEKGFTIEVVEAKNATNTSGRTFSIKSPPSRH